MTPPPKLIDCLGQTLILAYRESTERLETTLTQAGCDCKVLRQVHQPGYDTYSRSYLCLLNHQQAWQFAVRSERPTLIVEADFVPVFNLGELPPPFDPNAADLGIAWLYTCASQVYSLTETGYALGYSTAMVAYIISAAGAQLLLQLAAEVAENPGPTAYTPWDSGIEYYLRDRGLSNYVPFRNYGEHGGIPNPEHRQNRLSQTHRADILYGRLAFTPIYAHATSTGLRVRVRARLKGIARLLLGKYLRLPVLFSSDRPLPLLRFALARHFTRQI
ncbi:MAG: LPS biosynthesis glycosyltransferase [Leptolyngbyaceae cyanobacterium SM1_1_3]|nr:LPS biosynthesis glycosyltransferase [Leptolyngbyaceae cyanobacterium SM1_1_3]NJN03432.1 LPS biosynthesis glycosyltransferase [Leptolyngbyaceae cyanobacterium RM1_1_2]NJO08805.1 LPS biosynthesis glycosyltransferase [Leptolyngbyaceae cyanobacterium SL_1_1]